MSSKTAKNLRINITRNALENVLHCFILSGKGLPIHHYSTIADVFCDVFCDVYLWSFKVLHFRKGDVVMEALITHTPQSGNFERIYV